MAGHLIDLKTPAAEIDHIALRDVLGRRKIHLFSIDILHEIAVEILHPRLIYQHRKLKHDLIVHSPVRCIQIRIVEPVIAQHMIDMPVRIHDRDRQVGIMPYKFIKIGKSVCRIDQARLLFAFYKVYGRIALLVKLIDAFDDFFYKVDSVFCLCHVLILSDFFTIIANTKGKKSHQICLTNFTLSLDFLLYP